LSEALRGLVSTHGGNQQDTEQREEQKVAPNHAEIGLETKPKCAVGVVFRELPVLITIDFFSVVVPSLGGLVEAFELAEVIIIPARTYVRLASVLLNDFLQLFSLLVVFFSHEDLNLSLLLLERAEAARLAERKHVLQRHRAERVLGLDASHGGLDLLFVKNVGVVE
jgi:hypothetical protein